MPRTTGVHKVGLTAATFGLLALFALPFSTLRSSRIQTGVGVGALGSVGYVGFAVLAILWLGLVVFSLRNDRRRFHAASRGAFASGALLATIAMFGVAADRLLLTSGLFARVSIASGGWACVLAAYMAILSARREVGPATAPGIVLSAAGPAGIAGLLLSGRLQNLGMLREYANQQERFWAEVGAQVTFSFAAIAIASILGVMLGVLAFRQQRLRGPIFATVSVFQTIPGLAMIGLLFAPLAWLGQKVPFFQALGVGGLGWAPVVTALTLYALLSVVRNTYVGLSEVPRDIVEAGLGMGMSEGQVMRRVRFPLAMPVLFTGLRTAAVQTIGNATLGAFVAAGTLGLFVFGGLSQQASDLIMLGSVGIVVLALVAEGFMRMLQGLLSPRHIQGEGEAR